MSRLARVPKSIGSTAPLRAIVALFVVAATLGLPGSAVEAQSESDGSGPGDSGVPGNGQVVRVARPTWDTGWFQAEVVAQLVSELGYVVDGPRTMESEDFYREVESGGVDFWVSGWFPLHESFLADAAEATPLGFEVRGGALQGYMADRETVERLGITSLADLTNPEIASVFDVDGDGMADLVGCNDGWACQPIVDHHIDAYGLDETVTQVTGDYGPLMLGTVDRFRGGGSVLFYTFTPNWTTGALVPGRDVVWLPVPFSSLPSELAGQEPETTVAGIPGCLTDPCDMGFPPNDIRAVANNEFREANPALDELLTLFEISLDDISEQNASMIGGEDSVIEIAGHASGWIAAHREVVDEWLRAATDTHVGAGLALSPRRPLAGDGGEQLGALRVVTRLAPPFVTYEHGAYGGFSIEMLELLADEVGATLEVYGVNTSAKLVDEVARGSADVGIGAIAITSEREQLVDFSQPYFDSGLQILVSDRGDGFLGGRLGAVVGALFSTDLLFLLLVLIVVLAMAAHVVWFAERRHNPDFPRSYRAGIWEALWWAAVTATTVGYGDKTPKGRTGRLFGLFWMFSGLFVLAYFTAGIATTFTIKELSSQIETLNDLRGNAVGVPADSDAAEFLDRQGIAATEYQTAEDAYAALHSGDIDAVVHNAAILQHFVTNDARGGTGVAGLVFAERGFGLIIPPDSELSEPLNRSLLSLIESGDFDALHDTWFGNDPRSSG